MIQKIQSCKMQGHATSVLINWLARATWGPASEFWGCSSEFQVFPTPSGGSCLVLNMLKGIYRSSGRLVAIQDNAIDFRHLPVSQLFHESDLSRLGRESPRDSELHSPASLVPREHCWLFPTEFLSPLHIVTLLPPSQALQPSPICKQRLNELLPPIA